MDRPDLEGRLLARCVASLGAKWDSPASLTRVEIQFSPRLRFALGRCLPSRGIVRLNRRLLAAQPALFEEVLCHELAHLVVFDRHGRRCRPHGPEWAALMRAAGFEPRVRARLTHDVEAVVRAVRASRPLYEHRCPICQAMRLARRSVPQWRCAACAAAGLEGKLVILKRAGRRQ